MNVKKGLWASALATVGASLCCVAPLVLVTLGIGGAWIASLASLEPLRPLFVVMTVIDYDRKLAMVTFDDAKTSPDALTWATGEAGYPATIKGALK